LFQFVGGDTAKQCVPIIKQLRTENKGCIFAYSIEVDESQAAGHSTINPSRVPVYKRIVEEIIRSIDVAADFDDHFSSSVGRKTWVAVKMV
jgi:proline dehydrogenase